MAITEETLATRIVEAMKASEMSQRALAAAIGLDPSTLSKALSGKRGFKPLELALISETLGIPVQRLLADDAEAAERESVAARVQPGSSLAVERALARVRQMLELDDLLSSLGSTALPVHRPQWHPRGQPYRQGELLAERLRIQLGLGDADLPTEVSLLAADVEDKCNIDVAIEPLERGLDGLAITRQGYCLIMIGSSIAAHRQRNTIAHELGHLMASDHGDIVDENINYSRTPEESRANAFAAAFLMPGFQHRGSGPLASPMMSSCRCCEPRRGRRHRRRVHAAEFFGRRAIGHPGTALRAQRTVDPGNQMGGGPTAGSIHRLDWHCATDRR
jgi:transcriptional regulator with XRE-family HTH domain